MRHQRQRSREKKVSRRRDNNQQSQHHRRQVKKSQSDNRTYHKNQERIKKTENKIQQIIENRRQVCPFLVRIYYSFNNPNTYKKMQDVPKDRELILHLWMSSSLSEITELLRAHLPQIRSKPKYVFNRVHEEGNRLVKNEIGTVIVEKKSLPFAQVDHMLGSINFQIGDMLDITIYYA